MMQREDIGRVLIKEAMTRQKWTVSEIAKELGVTANSIWRMKKGTINPANDKLLILAEWAGHDPAEVLLRRTREQAQSNAKRYDIQRMMNQTIAAKFDAKTFARAQSSVESTAVAGAMSTTELKQIRKTMRWSQRQLAEQLGVAKNTVTRWEARLRKRIPAPVERHLRLIVALRTTISR